MVILSAEKTQLKVQQTEVLTSGAVNAYQVRFEFSPDWEGLTRTAVFRSGPVSVSVLLEDDLCVIPWEVLAAHGRPLLAGVYGTQGGEVVLPTVWAGLGTVQEGVLPGAAGRPHVQNAYQQLLQRLEEKADGLACDGLELTLTAGGRTLAAVSLPQPGGPAGAETATDEEMDALLDEVFGTSRDSGDTPENMEG